MKVLTHSQTSKVLTTFNHAGGSLNLCKGQQQAYPNNPVFSIFLLWAACWAHIMCHQELWYPYTQYWFRWTNISERYAPFDLNLRWGYLITFIPLFPFFNIVMTHLSYCIPSHLKGVVAAQLQWHLPNMNVIKTIRYLLCHIMSGALTW